MKLPDEVRTALRAGEAVEHFFTQPIKRDGVYTVHNANMTLQGHFRVVQVVQDYPGWRALICAENDPVRLLPSVNGDYTDFPGRALQRGDEPGAELEAVDEETQNRFSEKARQEFEAKREDRKRVQKLEYVQRKARSTGLDMTPLSEAIDRQMAELEAQIQGKEAA